MAGCLAFAGIAFAWERPREGITWQRYDDSIVLRARETGMPVMMDFAADWCFPCRQLDAITFSNGKVVAESRRFVTLRADLTRYTTPEAQELRKRYDVLGVPTILFLNSSGREEAALRTVGFIGADALLAKMQSVH